jgi:2,3-bisphosphoglycerate-dependent phosphoglycerate mutase
MSTTIIFETHSTTEDNEAGIATGWLPGRLSDTGRANAVALGRRRRDDGLSAVLVSDLQRAVETVESALGDCGLPVLKDWRLRECDYGELNGAPAASVHSDRGRHLDEPYPAGESWRQATGRVQTVLAGLPGRWAGGRILVVGHVATRWGLEIALAGSRLEDLVTEDFAWREGWEYQLEGRN